MAVPVNLSSYRKLPKEPKELLAYFTKKITVSDTNVSVYEEEALYIV